jgi:hypothetical protein
VGGEARRDRRSTRRCVTCCDQPSVLFCDVQGGGRGFSIHVSTRAQTSHAVAQTSRVAPYLPSMILNWLHTLSLDKA